MINFIIIEDDKKMMTHVKDVINKSLFKSDIEYEFKLFSGYNNELNKVINDLSNIKIYIMDIELDNSISGIEIAKKIRANDWESEIIFLTSHDHMFETAFRNIYGIFNFIEKFDNMEQRLTHDIKEISKHNFDNKTFKYSNRTTDLQIYLKTINYITRDTTERKLVIYTDNNTFEVNMTISDMLNNLDNRFKQVSRSTIVNKDKVNEINWNKGYFILENGTKEYLVSKKFKGEYDK